MRPFATLLAVVVLLAGCATAPSSSERIDFESANYGFLNEVMAGDAGAQQSVWGYLMTPAGPPPWPAIVMLHSASGPGSQDWFYAELFRDAGYAAFVVDSFGARGVTRTVDDQTLVTEASMLADAFAARRALAADVRIDDQHIALVGFSKGGIAALYGALETIRDAYDGDRFSAHAAFYPWCGLRPLDVTTTGAPVLIQMGDNDNVTPVSLCRDVVASMASDDVALVIYPGVRHAFDHPSLDGLDWVPVTGMIPSDCLIEEKSPGIFVERTTGDMVDGASLRDVLGACGRRGAEAGGDAEAAAQARQALLDFLAAALSP